MGEPRPTRAAQVPGVIDVLLNGQPFASASITGGGPTTIVWQPFSYQFTATSTSTLLTFKNAENPLQHFAMLDGVRVHVCDGSPGCTGGAPPVADDVNPCTADSCTAGTGVTHTPLANGTSCSDLDACTQTDTCQAGTCVGANPVVCVAQDQCHVVGTCAPATGACSNPTKADGVTCNDGATCTQSESCQAGACQPPTGAPPVLNLAVDDVGTLGGTYASAEDINASGQIAGNAATADGRMHRFLAYGNRVDGEPSHRGAERCFFH